MATHSLSFETSDGPLSKTTLTCPECGQAFTGRTRNAAQRARYEHVRAECYADILSWATRLSNHDSEVRDDDA